MQIDLSILTPYQPLVECTNYHKLYLSSLKTKQRYLLRFKKKKFKYNNKRMKMLKFMLVLVCLVVAVSQAEEWNNADDASKLRCVCVVSI